MSTSVTTTENIRHGKSEQPVTLPRPSIDASTLESDNSWTMILPGYEVLDCLGRGGMGIVSCGTPRPGKRSPRSPS